MSEGAYEILRDLIGPADRSRAIAEIDRIIRDGEAERPYPHVRRIVAPPFGQALLGAGPGATVTYQGPRRELSVEVVSVRLA